MVGVSSHTTLAWRFTSMKKTSTASFIVAIVLVVASIALFVLGALSINAPQVYSKVGSGYSYMRVSYNFSLSRALNGFTMVLIGGFLFLGGLLMFILAAVTRPAKPCCNAAASAPAQAQPKVIEAPAACCTCDAKPSVSSEPEKAGEPSENTDN